MVKVGLYVPLKAKPGKEAELETFLKGALPLAQQEPATTAWFALKMGPSTFGIFDVFPDDAGRDAHLTGPIAAALMAKASELLADPPKIEKLDVLAVKLPWPKVRPKNRSKTIFVCWRLGCSQMRNSGFPHPPYCRGARGSPILAHETCKKLILGGLSKKS